MNLLTGASLLALAKSIYYLISYDDGLINDGECFLYDLDYSTLGAVLFVA